ncbi:MAG: hypothetical protein B0W54_13005 [Cellvibrio sp. 79]|nr:MAG: hypothetical protein B0W54_13005 [Cellvibrio sp. 79]
MIVIRSIFFVAIFLLSGCSNVNNKNATDLSIKYEIVDIKSCSFVAHIEGSGHIYSKGVTKKIDAHEQYVFKSDDMVYLEKGSLVVIEASDKFKILLDSRQKKSSYRIRLEASAAEKCE